MRHWCTALTYTSRVFLTHLLLLRGFLAASTPLQNNAAPLGFNISQYTDQVPRARYLAISRTSRPPLSLTYISTNGSQARFCPLSSRQRAARNSTRLPILPRVSLTLPSYTPLLPRFSARWLTRHLVASVISTGQHVTIRQLTLEPQRKGDEMFRMSGTVPKAINTTLTPKASECFALLHRCTP